jgi:hypothetical protein
VLQADPTAPFFAGTTLSIDGVTYTWSSGSEFENDRTDYYGVEGGGSLTVNGLGSNANLAVVSGAANGYIQNGTYYPSYVQHAEGGSYSFNGWDYYWVSGETTYSVDLMAGSVNPSSIVNTYEEGSGGSFTISTDGTGTGTVSGAENGYVVDGNMYVNTYGENSSPQNSVSPETWFGGAFYFSSGNYSHIYVMSGNVLNLESYWTDYYFSNDGGSMSLHYSPWGYPYTLTISGWDPYLGDLNGVWADFEAVWTPRTNPTFAPGQLWVDGSLVEWQSGTLATNGTVVDHYTGSTPQGPVELNITGDARAYHSGQSANVTLNGTAVGTCLDSGYAFNVSGCDIQRADPNRSEPLFAGSSVWVNGTEYFFAGGYEVPSTNTRTDTYENLSAGNFTITGQADAPISAANPGIITGTHFSVAFSGTYDGEGTFSSETVEIHDYAPASGAPAIWINGVFYTRATPYSNTYNGAAGASMTLSGPNQNGMTVSGTDGTSAFSGAYPAEGTGLFFLTQGSAFIPACPANLNGTLLLSGESAPQGLPPAVSVPGYGILHFVGTGTTEEVSTAYFMNAAGGVQQVNVLLSIRVDSGAVLLKNFVTSTSLVGSYNSTSHIFQTGTEQSLPMPIYGVNPNANNAVWELLAPSTNRPATLIVGGDIWRYSGTDQNDAAQYLGYYSGQKLIMAAIPGSNGLVAVVVTDPVDGNSTGTYNETRKSFTMDSGLAVYRGDLEGERVIETPGESNNLYTIAADLDITGNLLSLGSLSTDASFAGMTLQFFDDGTTATLSSALARPSATWRWLRMESTSSVEAVPMMELDSAHRLNLYTPEPLGTPGIELNPAVNGTSRFKGSVSVEGVLRVNPAGDLEMGEFTNGPQP